MTVFRLPDLGEGLSEAEVLRWHVQIGDRIRVDEPMLAVETAKAVVEVPSPVSGTITALHARPGDRIEIGAPLVEFTVDAAGPQPEASTASAGGAAAPTVVGQMPATADELPVEQAAPAAEGRHREGLRPRAVPAARALARQLGVELERCHGTGTDGLITIADVLARAGLATSTGATTEAEPVDPPPGMHAQAEPVRGLRRAMAQSMSISRDSVAACTVFDDADVSRWKSAADYSVRVLRAIGLAARSEPALNAWYDAARGRRLLFTRVDVGVAVDTPEGLIVPVIRDVAERAPAALRAELDRIKRGARERTLPAEELRHCTIMLSNFGSLAGRYATPIVVPPAVAILAAGRVRPEERRLPLSLSFDHRVVTGGEAVRFLSALIADLELAQ